MWTNLLLAGQPILPAWHHFREEARDYVPYYILAALLAGGLLVYRVHKWLQDYWRDQESWKRVRERCQRAHLSPTEMNRLLRALEKVHISSREAALQTDAYYDNFLAPHIVNLGGQDVSDSVRKKLFGRQSGEDTKAAPEIHNTDRLRPGQKLRLYFAGREHGVNAVVLRVFKDELLVVLLPRGEEKLEIVDGARAEGTFETETTYLSFVSLVITTSPGTIFSCHLEHAPVVNQHRYASITRVPMRRRISFIHVPQDEVNSRESLRETIKDKARSKEGQNGIVRMISLEGCILATDSRAEFKVGDMVLFSCRLAVADKPPSFLGSLTDVTYDTIEKKTLLQVNFLGLSDYARHAIIMAVSRMRSDSTIYIR